MLRHMKLLSLLPFPLFESLFVATEKTSTTHECQQFREISTCRFGVFFCLLLSIVEIPFAAFLGLK
jgi:hypothetical protein